MLVELKIDVLKDRFSKFKILGCVKETRSIHRNFPLWIHSFNSKVASLTQKVKSNGEPMAN